MDLSLVLRLLGCTVDDEVDAAATRTSEKTCSILVRFKLVVSRLFQRTLSLITSFRLATNES